MAEKGQKLDRPERNAQIKQRNLARLSERRKEHDERMALRAKLSPLEQIAVLDRRLGKDQGAKKKRARLLMQSLN